VSRGELPPHGTGRRYQLDGCRCAECRAANAAYTFRHRAASWPRGSTSATVLPSGTGWQPRRLVETLALPRRAREW
jgi:hypothetical protein